jgi:heptosyltransferase-2
VVFQRPLCYGGNVLALDTLRRADTWLGWPLAVLLGLWPRRRRALPAAPREIAVVKLLGLGSLLTCAGVFRGLRAAQPRARVTVVTLAGGTEAAARLLPGVDDVLAVSAASPGALLCSVWQVWRELRRRRPDAIVDIEYFSKLSTVFCAASGARYRFGFRLPARWRGRLIDGGVAFREDIHFRECVARLLAPLGVDYRRLPAGRIAVPPTAEAAAERLLGAGGDWLALNPHATSLCLQRRWPLERFAEVAGALLQAHPDLRILVPGSADERPRSEALRVLLPEALRPRVRVLAGETDLPTLAAVLRRCRLVLTNDTGVMHLADAVGAPLVALFGPESTVRYGPAGDPDRTGVLTGDVPCGPCLSYMNRKRAPCEAEPAACMLAIGVRRVLDACERILAD